MSSSRILDLPLEQVIYIVAVLLVLVILTQPLKRFGIARLAGYAAAWIAIIGGAWVVLSEAPGVRAYLERINRITVRPAPEERLDVAGGEVRLRAEADGHFWAEADVNGRPVRFLVDTGASDVVLSARTASDVGIDVHALEFDRLGFTASGRVRAAETRIDSFRLGSIDRRNMPVSVLDGPGDINLLGMRFLRTLSGWRVEGDTLVLAS